MIRIVEPTLIAPREGAAVDAFHRLRVSSPVAQFTSMSEYIDNPLLWESALVGTGTSAYQVNKCEVLLSTGGSLDLASATRRTRRSMRYVPGEALLVLSTFVMSAPQTNAVAEIGYFNGRNGILLRRSGSTYQIVRCYYNSGSPQEEVVGQTLWNCDKLNGTGPSGINLNLEKTNILAISLQFLGVGQVRVGFDFGPKGVVVAHVFEHANIQTEPYMGSACLPLHGRVYNVGAATGTVTMAMICAAVAQEGSGTDADKVYQWAADNGITGKATTTALRPILAIRAATALGGGVAGTVRNYGQIVPTAFSLIATDQLHNYEVWLNPTSLTGASWVARDANSLAEYDVSASAINTAGGTMVDAGYLSAGGTSANTRFSNPGRGAEVLFPLSYTSLNNAQDTLVLCARTLTSTGTAYGSIQWEEKY